MQTVDLSKCPKCGSTTTVDDYYWQPHTIVPTKKNPNCKRCVREKERLRALEKREYAKMFF